MLEQSVSSFCSVQAFLILGCLHSAWKASTRDSPYCMRQTVTFLSCMHKYIKIFKCFLSRQPTKIYSPFLWPSAPPASKWPLSQVTSQKPPNKTSGGRGCFSLPPNKNIGPAMGPLKSALAILPVQSWKPPCWASYPNMENGIQWGGFCWSHYPPRLILLPTLEVLLLSKQLQHWLMVSFTTSQQP